MSLLLKVFPVGRPDHSAPCRTRASRAPVCVAVLALSLALVAVLLPLTGTATAARPAAGQRGAVASPALAGSIPASAPAKKGKKGNKGKKGKKAKKAKKPKPTAVPGQPRRNYAIPPTSYFSYPNRSKREREAIRKRLLHTIQSVWGGPRNSMGTAWPSNGSIRIAVWSFDDMGMAKALWAAHKRGVSVQVVVAKGANKKHDAWRWLRKRLRARLYLPGYPATREMSSFARHCKGSCRGPGGTAHSKYFLFDNVGATHQRHIVVQTSMNLTEKAYRGQWNQAQAMQSAKVYRDFLAIFRQKAVAVAVARPYHVRPSSARSSTTSSLARRPHRHWTRSCTSSTR